MLNLMVYCTLFHKPKAKFMRFTNSTMYEGCEASIKVYTHSHHFLGPRAISIYSNITSCGRHLRLTKPLTGVQATIHTNKDLICENKYLQSSEEMKKRRKRRAKENQEFHKIVALLPEKPPTTRNTITACSPSTSATVAHQQPQQFVLDAKPTTPFFLGFTQLKKKKDNCRSR
ncbi:hypothetical protein SLA2020_468000 [Shorea laevis]